MKSSVYSTDDGDVGDSTEEETTCLRRDTMRVDRRGVEGGIASCLAGRARMIGGRGSEGPIGPKDGFWEEARVLGEWRR